MGSFGGVGAAKTNQDIPRCKEPAYVGIT